MDGEQWSGLLGPCPGQKAKSLAKDVSQMVKATHSVLVAGVQIPWLSQRKKATVGSYSP